MNEITTNQYLNLEQGTLIEVQQKNILKCLLPEVLLQNETS